MFQDDRFNMSNPTPQQPAAAVLAGTKSQTPSLFSTSEESTRLSVMARYVHRRLVDSQWIDYEQWDEDSEVPGLALKQGNTTEYLLEPPNTYAELKEVCLKLGVAAAFTMSCETTDHVLDKLRPGESEVTLQPYGITVPVVQSLRDLATTDNSVRKRDYMCFVRHERVVLLWSQSVDGLLAQAGDVEDKLMASIWGAVLPSRPHSTYGGRSMASGFMRHDEKHWAMGVDMLAEEEDECPVLDAEELENLKPTKRPFNLTHSVMIGLACLLAIVAQSTQVRQVLYEVRALGGTTGLIRLSMLATFPIYLFFGLFFFTILAGNLFQAIGPIQDIKTGNTRTYSGTKPDRRKHPNIEWPHITIQMPVYKEGLKGVIQPTINSLLPAIAHYERIGGTASIFVCDDGMQVVKPEIAEMRRDFYRQHGIGWVARPPHGKDGFVRAGRFKKASNMNYALDFTLRVEDKLAVLIKDRKNELSLGENEELDLNQENQLYERAFDMVLESDDGRTWAEGNTRMGDIILLIDSDTQVPVDCLHLAAMEMEESPEVAIIQHASGVMQVTHSEFENCITYFTNMVYLAISFSVGSGDVAAFVGHNAFLRWKALQSIRFRAEDGRELFWSESHVSEDFDVALRIQTAGFVVRLATYDKGEFKEGVSLTIFDELLRWEKYAYGCSELLVNPLYKWIYKGPFTPMLAKFLKSNMKTSSKFTILGYMGTYYAIATAYPMALVNYFVVGWFADEIDPIYRDSWKIFVGLVIVFQIESLICYAIYRHRVGDKVFWKALGEGIKRSCFFVIFFGGISWHLCYSLLAHLLCLPIEWASTVKEIEASGFFISLDNVFKAYKWVLIFTTLLLGAMIYLGQFAPPDWTINQYYVIVPLAMQVAGHIGLPLLSMIM